MGIVESFHQKENGTKPGTVHIAGIQASDISQWRELSLQQRATLVAMRIRSEGDRTPIQSPDLLELLRQRGVDFNASQVRKTLYDPLVAGGWIEHAVGKEGRGGKGGALTLTQKGLDLDVEVIEGLRLGDIPAELQELLAKPTLEILDELLSPVIHVKGIALELLALRLASECGLQPVELRMRGVTTGGAEVDLVAEGAPLHFSRWLFRCKNQKSNLGLSVLAKELGMATLLRAQVVVIVTTGLFAQTVRDYARQAAETTAIQIILLDQKSLAAYKASGPSALRKELHDLALATLALKRDQLAEVPKDE